VSTSSRNLQHIVVVMMSSRSFDHMLGGLKFAYPQINGLTGDESNPDTKGALVKVQPRARFQGSLEWTLVLCKQALYGRWRFESG
jgi:phospholipase C